MTESFLFPCNFTTGIRLTMDDVDPYASLAGICDNFDRKKGAARFVATTAISVVKICVVKGGGA